MKGKRELCSIEHTISIPERFCNYIKLHGNVNYYDQRIIIVNETDLLVNSCQGDLSGYNNYAIFKGFCDEQRSVNDEGHRTEWYVKDTNIKIIDIYFEQSCRNLFFFSNRHMRSYFYVSFYNYFCIIMLTVARERQWRYWKTHHNYSVNEVKTSI